MKPIDPTPQGSGTSGRKETVRNETVLTEAVQAALLEALAGMRYGQVILIIQDGKIVQIDRTEKVRLSQPQPGKS